MKNNSLGYIFFDFEAIQKENEVNLACAHKICIKCINKDPCERGDCGDYSFNTNNTFCEWLF